MNKQSWLTYLERQKERVAFWADGSKPVEYYGGQRVTSWAPVPGAIGYYTGLRVAPLALTTSEIKERFGETPSLPPDQQRIAELKQILSATTAALHTLRARTEAAEAYARSVTTKAEDTAGEHIYNGPVKDGASIPDEIHERFHKSIGDVLAGKVMPKAREQMRDALNRPVPDAPTTASKSRPMPGKAVAFGTQKIGIFVR